ncbi:MAG: rhodanese-like domain-containing protein [Schleiferiaceae bacterium]|jgi:rhodanese-related sulfurtransferase|nr:rhodanese-like domain-containing protein [Schleiferiaceae bacterium]
MGLLSRLFGLGPKADFNDLIQNQKAQIIDVRTPAEFKSGHVKGSKNIPLNTLNSGLGKIKKDKPVVLCCASGMRSGNATRILKSKGYEAYNGGSWGAVNKYVQ